MLDISKLNAAALRKRGAERKAMPVLLKLGIGPGYGPWSTTTQPAIQASSIRAFRTLELRRAQRTQGAGYLWLVEHHLKCAREECLDVLIWRARKGTLWPWDDPPLPDLRHPFDRLPESLRDRVDPIFDVVSSDVDPAREFEMEYERLEDAYKRNLRAVQAKTKLRQHGSTASRERARTEERQASVAVLESFAQSLGPWFDAAQLYLTGQAEIPGRTSQLSCSCPSSW